MRKGNDILINIKSVKLKHWNKEIKTEKPEQQVLLLKKKKKKKKKDME
jgi:hypothetical protein